MKIKFLLLLLHFIALSSLYATTFEDGKSQNTLNWSIYDNTPTTASMSNTIDDDVHGEVIELLGEDLKNGFVIGGFPSQTKAWQHSTEKVLGFDLKTNEKFLIFISLETTDGFRFLSYAPLSYNSGLRHGLGINAKNGEWHTFHRDLEADLKEVEPHNSIVTVNGLFFRGSARIDNIELISEIPELPPVTISEEFRVYDNTPTGATVTTVTDDLKGEVVMLNGDGTKNGYAIGGIPNSSLAWNETNKTKLLWSMKYNENFLIFVSVNTAQGHKYLMYAPVEYSTGYLHGLGSSSIDDTWRDFNRDLTADLADADPSNELLSVNGFFIRGSGLISTPHLESATVIQPVCNREVTDLLRDSLTSRYGSYSEEYIIEWIAPLYPILEEYAYYFVNASFTGSNTDRIMRVNCRNHSQIEVMYHSDYNANIDPLSYIGTINGVAFYPVHTSLYYYPTIVGFGATGPAKVINMQIYSPTKMTVEGDHIIIEDYGYYRRIHQRSVYDENGTLLSTIAL